MGKGSHKRPTNDAKFREGYDKAFGESTPWYEQNRYKGEPEVLSGGSPLKDDPPQATQLTFDFPLDKYPQFQSKTEQFNWEKSKARLRKLFNRLYREVKGRSTDQETNSDSH